MIQLPIFKRQTLISFKQHLIKLRQTSVLLPKRNSFDNNIRQPITIHYSFLYEAY